MGMFRLLQYTRATMSYVVVSACLMALVVLPPAKAMGTERAREGMFEVFISGLTMPHEEFPLIAPSKRLTHWQAKDGRWGYVRCEHVGQVDADPNEVVWEIPPTFRQAMLFCEGAAAVELGGAWGFIDEDGRFLIEPRYTYVSSFNGGYAVVRDGCRWGFVDRAGRVAIEPQFESACGFDEGLAVVQKDGKWGFIDTSGAFVIPPQFDDARSFQDGLALASKGGGKSGFIDRSGVFLIPPQFDDADRFTEGVAPVRKGDKWGFVTRAGELLTDMMFDQVWFFIGGHAPVRSGDLWGVLGRDGQMRVPFRFEGMRMHYSEGVIGAKLDGKWGFIDFRGDWVISPSYDEIGDFRNGVAVVIRQDQLLLIDALGNVKKELGRRDE